MWEIKVSINDDVKLWNDEEGIISEIDLSTHAITITSESGYPTKCHKMNIRYLNGEEVDASDLTF